MNDFFVKINRQTVRIDKRVFLALLDLPHIHEYVHYTHAVIDGEISFADLKDLASRASVPYPLFFAPKNIVDKQIQDNDKNLSEKLPTKNEMQLNFRGSANLGDIELIAKDLGRKQEFIKNRILKEANENAFIGLVAKKVKDRVTNKEIADDIRSFLEIDLDQLRKMPKGSVLNYIVNKAENKDILVSFSSYNYMPQNIDREIGLSGFCVKDKRFPYVFINTRDGDDKPKILESAGRQIFTLVAMLVSISMNKFVLSTKYGKKKNDPSRYIYAIVGEILIPKKDTVGITISSLDEVREYSQMFKVTPSMVLFRFKELGIVDKKTYDLYKEKLIEEVNNAKPKQKNQPLPITGYGKYNGERFSREVVGAHTKGVITINDVKNVLFRRGKMKGNLLNDYLNKFK